MAITKSAVQWPMPYLLPARSIHGQRCTFRNTHDIGKRAVTAILKKAKCSRYHISVRYKSPNLYLAISHSLFTSSLRQPILSASSFPKRFPRVFSVSIFVYRFSSSPCKLPWRHVCARPAPMSLRFAFPQWSQRNPPVDHSILRSSGISLFLTDVARVHAL